MNIPEAAFAGVTILGEEDRSSSNKKKAFLDPVLHEFRMYPVIHPYMGVCNWHAFSIPIKQGMGHPILIRIVDHYCQLGLNLCDRLVTDFDEFKYENPQADKRLEKLHKVDMKLFIILIRDEVRTMYYEGKHMKDCDFQRHQIQTATQSFVKDVLQVLQRYCMISIWTFSELKFDPLDNPQAQSAFKAYAPNLVGAFPVQCGPEINYPPEFKQDIEEVWFSELKLKWALLTMTRRLGFDCIMIMYELSYLLAAVDLVNDDPSMNSWETWDLRWFELITHQSGIPLTTLHSDWQLMLYGDFFTIMDMWNSMLIRYAHSCQINQ